MTNTTALAPRSTNGHALATKLAPPEWTREYLDTLKGTYAKGTSDAEFALAVQVSKATGLRIDNRELWVYKRGANEPVTISISIDGFRAIAHASGVYAGEEGPLWCGKDGQWVDVWTEEKPPVAAKFTVYRTDFERPFTAVIHLAEFRNSSPLWQKAPVHQSGVRVASHAFRKAFRQEIASHEWEARQTGATLGEDAGDPSLIEVVSEGDAQDVTDAELVGQPAGDEAPAQIVDADTGEILSSEDDQRDRIAAIERYEAAHDALTGMGVPIRQERKVPKGSSTAQIERWAVSLETDLQRRRGGQAVGSK